MAAPSSPPAHGRHNARSLRITEAMLKLLPGGITSDVSAVTAAARNLEPRSITHVQLGSRHAAMAKPSSSTSAALVAPSPTGVFPVLSATTATRAEGVTHVARASVTLGRDLKKLEAAGFSPRTLHIFNMFPQTSRIETVAHLVRARRS